MIEENAVVIGVEDEMAMLEIVRRKPCGLCGKTRGCGMSLWGRLFGHRSNVFRAVNQVNAKAGDEVVVGIDEQALLRGSLTAYGVPLLTLLVGALLGGVFAGAADNADTFAVFGAVAGLVVGALWLKAHAAGSSLDGRYHPVILRRDDKSTINLKCERGE